MSAWQAILNKQFSFVCLVSIVATMATCPSNASAAPGVLLIAHGSPSPEWNRPVLGFGKIAEEAILARGGVTAVRTALLEAAEPSIPAAVKELEAAGCDRIIAIPLFIAPSGHTHFDVPAALGIYTSPETSKALAAEGAVPAVPRVPIVLLPTLSEGDLLQQYVVDQVRKLSKSPQEEAIILLAHGDPEHELLVERLLRRIASYGCGQTGIDDADWASIGVGQEYLAQGIPVINAALERKKRVVVVGLYLSTTAAKIHARHGKAAQGHSPAITSTRTGDVVFSEEPLIAHPGCLNWVVESVHNTLASPK
jgi:sirohydrochlorin ferrochelatase